MPSLAPAAHFSKVFCDYLSSASALTYGAPALDAVQRRHYGSEVEVTHPDLLIEAVVDPESSDALLTVAVKLVLTVQIGVEEGQTTEEQAYTWLQAFRALLSTDRNAYDAWDAWGLTLTDEEKSGWYVQAVYPQTPERDLNEESGLLTLTAPYQVVSFWNN